MNSLFVIAEGAGEAPASPGQLEPDGDTILGSCVSGTAHVARRHEGQPPGHAARRLCHAMVDSSVPLPREIPPGEGAGRGTTPHLWGRTSTGWAEAVPGPPAEVGWLLALPLSPVPSSRSGASRHQPYRAELPPASPAAQRAERGEGASGAVRSPEDTRSQGWPPSELAREFLPSQMSNFP